MTRPYVYLLSHTYKDHWYERFVALTGFLVSAVFHTVGMSMYVREAR